MTKISKAKRSEAATLLSRSRPLRTIKCEVCGTDKKVRDASAKYCSNACKVRAYRERRAGLESRNADT